MKTNGFSVRNWKNFKPMEDYFKISNDGSVIVLADGITRDPLGMPFLPSKQDVFGMLSFFQNYPKPSPAAGAAESFSVSFARTAKDLSVYPRMNGREIIINAFNAGNEKVKELGEEYKRNCYWPDFDYLERDFPGCVAVGLVEDKGIVYYGYVADCGLAVFNSKGNIKFKTENQGPNSRGSIDDNLREKHNLSFRSPEGRRLIRKEYRNNPSNPLAYGALTGEKQALSYLTQGEVELGDNLVVAYTDGLEDIIVSGKFADLVRKSELGKFRKLCKQKVATEGTLAYIKK